MMNEEHACDLENKQKSWTKTYMNPKKSWADGVCVRRKQFGNLEAGVQKQ